MISDHFSARQLLYPQFWVFFGVNRLHNIAFKIRSQPLPQIYSPTSNTAPWWIESPVSHHFWSPVGRTAAVASDFNPSAGL
jgi:hypothetical protein